MARVWLRLLPGFMIGNNMLRMVNDLTKIENSILSSLSGPEDMLCLSLTLQLVQLNFKSYILYLYCFLDNSIPIFFSCNKENIAFWKNPFNLEICK